jgi:hypothetical protein
MPWLSSLGKVIDMAVKFWEDRQSAYPCKDCLERTVGCHSTCQKYIAVKAESKRQAEIIMDINNKNDDVDDFRNRTLRKIRKRCNGR